MDPEVLAAWVAAAAAAMSALVNAYVTAQGNRHTREMELVVSALNHFVGGSQERNSGIAALRVLSGVATAPNRGRRWRPTLSPSKASPTWHKYGHAVGRLFCGQVVYILVHGKNRWQAHEIANVVAMIEWLLEDETLGLDSGRDRQDLLAAMRTYKADWAKRPNEVGSADQAVKFLIDKIDEWTGEWKAKELRPVVKTKNDNMIASHD